MAQPNSLKRSHDELHDNDNDSDKKAKDSLNTIEQNDRKTNDQPTKKMRYPQDSKDSKDTKDYTLTKTKDQRLFKLEDYQTIYFSTTLDGKIPKTFSKSYPTTTMTRIAKRDTTIRDKTENRGMPDKKPVAPNYRTFITQLFNSCSRMNTQSRSLKELRQTRENVEEQLACTIPMKDEEWRKTWMWTRIYERQLKDEMMQAKKQTEEKRKEKEQIEEKEKDVDLKTEKKDNVELEVEEETNKQEGAEMAEKEKTDAINETLGIASKMSSLGSTTSDEEEEEEKEIKVLQPRKEKVKEVVEEKKKKNKAREETEKDDLADQVFSTASMSTKVGKKSPPLTRAKVKTQVQIMTPTKVHAKVPSKASSKISTRGSSKPKSKIPTKAHPPEPKHQTRSQAKTQNHIQTNAKPPASSSPLKTKTRIQTLAQKHLDRLSSLLNTKPGRSTRRSSNTLSKLQLAQLQVLEKYYKHLLDHGYSKALAESRVCRKEVPDLLKKFGIEVKNGARGGVTSQFLDWVRQFERNGKIAEE